MEDAERWARSALDYAYQTELYACHGETGMQLSRTLAARGRVEEATDAARAALEVYERKGDRPRIDQARAQLEALAAR